LPSRQKESPTGEFGSLPPIRCIVKPASCTKRKLQSRRDDFAVHLSLDEGYAAGCEVRCT
jgi:hypothetical protein